MKLFYLFVHCSMNAKGKQQAFFGEGNGRIWMDELECTDYDTDLLTCSQNAMGIHNCVHGEDAGVVCNIFAGMHVHWCIYIWTRFLKNLYFYE